MSRTAIKRKAREDLNSKTKACVDKGDPTFRKTSTGELVTKPSQEALRYHQLLQAVQHGSPPVKKPEEVKAEAIARVLSEGGDPGDDWLVLSRFIIQLGKYKGQTFKWLLENDVGFTAWLVDDHQKEQEHTTCRQNPLMANKDSLTKYVTAYPEVMKEVHRRYKRSLQSGQEGKALVDFGLHKSETLQDLYESKDPEKIDYVNFLRGMNSTCTPGSKMEIAVRYILQRDQEEGAAAAKRLTRKKRVQSPRGQPTSASRPIKKKPKISWKRTSFPPLSPKRCNKHFVDKHKVELIKKVSNVGTILDELLAKRVIQQDLYDKIRALPTNQEKMRELYSGPLKAGEACKKVFYKILEENEPYLIDDLKKKK